MNWSTRAAYRERLIDWVQLDRWQAPFAVTLTLRQCVTVPNGTTSVTQWLTDTAATQNMRHFLNKLDRSVFGKAATRFGKRVGCVPILEGGTGNLAEGVRLGKADIGPEIGQKADLQIARKRLVETLDYQLLPNAHKAGLSQHCWLSLRISAFRHS